MPVDETERVARFQFGRVSEAAVYFRRVINASDKLRRFAPLIPVVAFVCACWLLHRELVHYRIHDIRQALWQIPAVKLLAALALTTCSYLILIVCEFIALRAAGCSLPVTQIATTSLVSYATSYNFGPLLGNTLMRFRLYSLLGVQAPRILNVIVVSVCTFWAGVCGVLAALPLIQPSESTREATSIVSILPLRLVSMVAAGILVAYVAVNVIYRKSIHAGGLSIRLPGPALVPAQILVGTTDLAVVASVLWVLLPASLHVRYLDLLAGYILAVLATVFSHVPGGLGVFELVVLSIVLPDHSPAAVGALILFRMIYFLLPLCLATATYLCQEYRLSRRSGF